MKRLIIAIGVLIPSTLLGSHAAMPHYVATAESDRRITRDEIYLVDSGAQYLGNFFATSNS